MSAGPVPACRVGNCRQYDLHLHHRQRHCDRHQGFQCRHARREGERIRRRPPRPLLLLLAAAGWNRKHVSDTLCHAVDVVPTLLDLTGALEARRPEVRRRLPPRSSTRMPGWSGRSLSGHRFPAGPRSDQVETDRRHVSGVAARQWQGTVRDQDRPGPAARCRERPSRAGGEDARAFYDAWWAELEPTFAQTTEIPVGHPDHRIVSLTSHDWIQEALAPVEPAAHPAGVRLARRQASKVGRKQGRSRPKGARLGSPAFRSLGGKGRPRRPLRDQPATLACRG